MNLAELVERVARAICTARLKQAQASPILVEFSSAAAPEDADIASARAAIAEMVAVILGPQSRWARLAMIDSLAAEMRDAAQ